MYRKELIKTIKKRMYQVEGETQEGSMYQVEIENQEYLMYQVEE